MSKFCVTCKWHCLRQPVAYDERSWKNQRPGGCGPDGKNWEAAP